MTKTKTATTPFPVISDEAARPLLEDFYNATSALNAAIVKIETAGIKWDLQLVDSPDEPVAVQTIYAAEVVGGNKLRCSVHERCTVPGTQMEFTPVIAQMMGRQS